MNASPPAPSLVVLGGSAGGLDAARTLLSALPADFPWPVALVLHRVTGFEPILAEMLQRVTALRIVEPDGPTSLAAGTVFVAPADYHLLVEQGGVAISTDAPVNHARPSVDVLFESAADAFGPAAVAIVLTGTGNDGARGSARLAEAGARVLVQDPATAEAPAMPAAALAAVPDAETLPLAQITPHLLALANRDIAHNRHPGSR